MSDKKKDSNPVGRPPVHSNPESMNILIKDYYEWIEGEWHEEEVKKITEIGEVTTKVKIWDRKPEPPTVTGLALHLGFNSKQTLYNYSEKPEFVDSIKKAITRIEKYHEIQVAYGDKCTGNIFALKNFGWKDRIETEVTGRQEIVWHEERTYEADDKTDQGT